MRIPNISPAGKITLPSTIIQFWDLGGQRGIRNIWPKYYGDCHAVVYVLDAEDRERLGEGLEVFGTTAPPSPKAPSVLTEYPDSVLSNQQILEVPLLLLANKQDSPMALSVEEIRNGYEDWHQSKLESARRDRFSETETSLAARKQRLASLDVMGVSALEGYAPS